jgi:hypothetical protein
MFSSPRPTKASQLVSCLPGVLSNRRPAAIVSAVQCGSSGYESIVRDSECSSFGSSQDSDAGEPHDPGGSKKGANCKLVLEQINSQNSVICRSMKCATHMLYMIMINCLLCQHRFLFDNTC